MKSLQFMLAPIAFTMACFPLALVMSYFLLPSERTLILDTQDQIDLIAALERSEKLQRVGAGDSLELIQAQEFRLSQLRPGQSLWLLQPRAGFAGLSWSNELERISARFEGVITFQRQPHKRADKLFWIMLGIAAMTGLVFTAARQSSSAAA